MAFADEIDSWLQSCGPGRETLVSENTKLRSVVEILKAENRRLLNELEKIRFQTSVASKLPVQEPPSSVFN